MADDAAHDEATSSAQARAALAHILERPAVSLAALIGEPEPHDDRAANRHDDSGALEHDDDDENVDMEQTTAQRRALLASLSHTDSGGGVDADADDAATAASADASRASMYSELHSYLDALKERADLLPPDFDSIVDNMTAEHAATAAATAAAGSSQRSDRPDAEPSQRSPTAAASSAASSFDAAASPARRSRYQFAPPFSPPNAQVLPRSSGNRTPSPSSRARFDTESKELDSAAVSSDVAAPASAAGSRKPAAITTLSPAGSPTQLRSSPRSQHSVRPSSTTSASTAAAMAAASTEHKTSAETGEDLLNGPDIGPLEDGEAAFNPDDPFDEAGEMGKIAELDALLAEAEGRATEMDRRLAALMSEPLPALPGCNGDSSGLLLMPPSPSHAQAHASAHAAANEGNDFFMTSVPGGAGFSGDAAAAAAAGDEDGAVATAASAGAATAPAPDDPSLWVLEDVEEMDAPVVLALGEGFRPSAEDQSKLDEIDALLNHFRASDSSLPSSYRPRFVHPPVKKLRKKKRVAPAADATATASASAASVAAQTAGAAAAVAAIAANEDEDEEEVEAEASLSPSDPAVVARVALMVHPSSSASSSSSALIASAQGSVDFAADGSSIDLSEEERAELKKLNKKLSRMQKNAAAAAAPTASAAGRATDPDSLRRLLAKTQASAAAGGGAAVSSFPSFSFPKSSSSAYKSVASTDAIFHALFEEEEGQVEGQGQSGMSTARSASRQRPGHGGALGLDDDAAELEREIRSAMNDENELDEEAVGDDDAADIAQFDRDAEEEVPRDPRARMDRLAAQVAAIRARVHDDGDDYAFAPEERADEPHAAVASASSALSASSDRAKRAGHAVPGSRTAAARDRTVSAGTRRRGNSGSSSSSSSSAASLTARPRSDPAGPPGFDLHGLVASGPASSTGAGGGCDSPSSPAVSSRAHLSLADRLDEAIGVRPSSSSSSSSAAADSWRTWKPRGLAAAVAGSPASAAASASPPPFGAGLSVSASLDGGDMAGGSASMVRAAARGQQAAAAAAAAGLSSASPRFNGSASPSPRQVVAPVRQGRPLRALSHSGAAAAPGSGTALLAAMQGSPASSLHSARAAAAAAAHSAGPRPLSASSLELCVGGGPGSLPPPIYSTQAQIKASGSRSRLAQ